MISKYFKVVIFSAVVLCGAMVGLKFYESSKKDEDVIKNFVLK